MTLMFSESALAPASAIGLFLCLTLVGCKRDVKVDVPIETQSILQPPESESEPVADPEPAKDAQTLFAEAGQALEAGDIRAAGTAIRAAVSIEPANPQLVFMMATILGKEHRYPEAVMMLDELAVAVPDAELPVLGQTAEWLVTQGQWSEAESRYRAVLAAVPDAAIVHRQLSQLLIRQGRRIEAAQHLNILCQQGNIEEIELRTLLSLASPYVADLSREEFEPVGALGRARLAISTDDWNQASTELVSAKSVTPKDSALLGRIHAHRNAFEELEAWANEESNADSDTTDGWFARGVLAAHQSDHRGAVMYFCETVLRDPTDEQAYARMAESLDYLAKSSEAAQANERAMWLARTRAIGKRMAATDGRDLEAMAELAHLLEKLHRPFESLAWQAVRIAYGRSTLPAQEQQAQLIEINRRRLELLASNEPVATNEFILCGSEEFVKSSLGE